MFDLLTYMHPAVQALYLRDIRASAARVGRPISSNAWASGAVLQAYQTAPYYQVSASCLALEAMATVLDRILLVQYQPTSPLTGQIVQPRSTSSFGRVITDWWEAPPPPVTVTLCCDALHYEEVINWGSPTVAVGTNAEPD